MPLRVCAPLCDYSRVAAALRYAADNGADVVNMSLGGLPQGPSFVDDAVQYAIGKGVIVVIASGNDGQGAQVAYPGRIPGAIAVGAVGPTDERKGYSNGGGALSVVAPAGITTAYYKGGKYEAGVEGTSLSTPEVTGLVGLMLAINPDLTPAEAKSILEQTADKDPDMKGKDKTNLYGFGRINVDRALKRVETITVQKNQNIDIKGKKKKDKAAKKKAKQDKKAEQKRKAEEKKQADAKKKAEKKKKK